MMLWNILYIAAAKGTTEMCKYLINKGFPVNTLVTHDSVIRQVYDDQYQDISFVSPLMITAHFERDDNLDCLIKFTNNHVLEKSEMPDIEGVILNEMCYRLKEMHRSLKPTVIAGHHQGNVVLVVYSGSFEQREDSFCGKKTLFRNPRIVVREKTEPTFHEPENFPTISSENMTIAEQILSARAEHLWRAHSNLNMISVSPMRYMKGACKEQVCITLFCTSKGIVPYGEKSYPKFLDTLDGKRSLPVDVREGYFELCPTYATGNSRSFHSRLKMGCSISKDQGKGGTLGPFVEKHGQLGFLTCAHVLFDISQSPVMYDMNTNTGSIKVVQPAVGSISLSQKGSGPFQNAANKPCGVVQKAVFDPNLPVSIDAAFVRINNENRFPSQGHFAIDDTEMLETTGNLNYICI